MSHAVALEVVVVGLAGLVQAIADTGLACREQRRFQTDDGKSHEVDLVVTDEEGGTVGVKVDAKSGEARFIAHDCKGTKGTALARRITQRWAYSKVTEELRRKGYELAREEKQPDGSIRLVASRWK